MSALPGPQLSRWRRHAARLELGLWWVAGAAIVAAGWRALLAVPMSLDVAFVYHTAGRMLDGTRLYQDVVEINPPLVYWLSIPPAWLARAGSLDRVAVCNAYLSVWILTSLALSWKVMRRLAPFRADVIRRFSLLALLAINFILVACGGFNQFGQREHLAWVLTLPYLLCAAARVTATPICRGTRVGAGLLAGVGLALKPPFVLLWLLIEVYLAVRTRQLRPAARLESGVVVAMQGLYGLVVIVLAPAYLGLVRNVLSARVELMGSAWQLLGHWAAVAWIVAALTVALVRLPDADRVLAQILFVAATAFLLIALVQGRGFDYHYYPVSGTALLLLLMVSWRLGELSLAGSREPILRAVALACMAVVTVASVVSARSLPKASRWQYIHQASRLIEQHAAGGFVYQLSSTVDPLFPAILATDARWAGHFNELGLWLAFYASRDAALNPYNSPAEMAMRERQVFHTVIADLVEHPPRVLIVETSPCKLHMGCRQFDFLEYFGQDGGFRALIGQFRLLQALASAPGGSYAVYVKN